MASVKEDGVGGGGGGGNSAGAVVDGAEVASAAAQCSSRTSSGEPAATGGERRGHGGQHDGDGDHHNGGDNGGGGGAASRKGAPSGPAPAPSHRRPRFAPASAREASGQRVERRKVSVPPHRYTPLKANWLKIYEPIVRQLHLHVRMNLRQRVVELKTCEHTADASALQRGAEFVRAFLLGFDVADALALLRLDDLYIETFEVTDVKMLKGDHLSRAIGRIAGAGGRTKFAIENATKTRVVLADAKVHVLGSYQNVRLARDAISSLVLGSSPGKVYNKLRVVAARLNERF